MCKDSLESSFNVECAHGLGEPFGASINTKKIRMFSAVQCDDFLTP